MSTTITVRTDDSLRQALNERAAAQGVTVSELVRRILTEALATRPFGARAGHLKGKLELPRRRGEDWRARLREQNWRE